MTEVAKVEPDWVAIERDYRAGRDTLRAIADRNGVSHVAIQKRAKKEGWVRDLAGKIAAKTEALVTKDAVTKSVTKEDLVTEREIIEANAELNASVIRGQRQDIRRARELVSKLFNELEQTTDNIDLMEQIGELMARPDDAGLDKINDLYRKILSLPGRVDMVKKLVETLDKLIDKERKVFNIEDRHGGDEDPLASLIKAIQGNSVRPASYIEGEFEQVDG